MLDVEDDPSPIDSPDAKKDPIRLAERTTSHDLLAEQIKEKGAEILTVRRVFCACAGGCMDECLFTICTVVSSGCTTLRPGCDSRALAERTAKGI